MDPVVDTLSPRGLLIRLDLWLSARCILSSRAWCALALVGGPQSCFGRFYGPVSEPTVWVPPLLFLCFYPFFFQIFMRSICLFSLFSFSFNILFFSFLFYLFQFVLFLSLKYVVDFFYMYCDICRIQVEWFLDTREHFFIYVAHSAKCTLNIFLIHNENF